MHDNCRVCKDQCVVTAEPATSSGSPDVNALQYDTVDDLADTASAAGGQRAADVTSQSQLSALELENRLLKNEVTSLNDEMNAVIKRARDAHEGD